MLDNQVIKKHSKNLSQIWHTISEVKCFRTKIQQNSIQEVLKVTLMKLFILQRTF